MKFFTNYRLQKAAGYLVQGRSSCHTELKSDERGCETCRNILDTCHMEGRYNFCVKNGRAFYCTKESV